MFVEDEHTLVQNFRKFILVRSLHFVILKVLISTVVTGRAFWDC